VISNTPTGFGGKPEALLVESECIGDRKKALRISHLLELRGLELKPTPAERRLFIRRSAVVFP
jgi:hypothetical protein